MKFYIVILVIILIVYLFEYNAKKTRDKNEKKRLADLTTEKKLEQEKNLTEIKKKKNQEKKRNVEIQAGIKKQQELKDYNIVKNEVNRDVIKSEALDVLPNLGTKLNARLRKAILDTEQHVSPRAEKQVEDNLKQLKSEKLQQNSDVKQNPSRTLNIVNVDNFLVGNSKLTFENTFVIERNQYLARDIKSFYHSDYLGGGNWKLNGTLENMIWTIKNDVKPFPERLNGAISRLEKILLLDLPRILKTVNFEKITVCVVPRAKKDLHYRNDQLYFRECISNVLNKLEGFENGVSYIVRHTNTRTTHLSTEGGDGKSPYIGITKDTCTISNKIVGKNILLIDDIYTKNINIDEDAIQALLDKGAKSVIFYALGKTVSRY